jgi:hypothetical protein
MLWMSQTVWLLLTSMLTYFEISPKDGTITQNKTYVDKLNNSGIFLNRTE